MEGVPDSNVQLCIAVPWTMLEKQGGRSLKNPNLQREERQWAQKASAVVRI